MSIAIYRFFTKYGPLKEPVEVINADGDAVIVRKRVPGKTGEIHFVEYGPLGSQSTRVVAQVSHLVPKIAPGMDVQPGSSVEMAIHKWEQIEAAYEKWKQGQEITPDGTPLAAWSGVGPEQAEGLKQKGISTVDQLAELSDSHIERYGIQGLRVLRDNAKRFISTLDKSTVEQAIAEKDVEIAGLRDTLAEMQTMMREMAHTVANLKMAQQEPSVSTQPDSDPGNDDAFGGEGTVAVTTPRRRARTAA